MKTNGTPLHLIPHSTRSGQNLRTSFGRVSDEFRTSFGRVSDTQVVARSLACYNIPTIPTAQLREMIPGSRNNIPTYPDQVGMLRAWKLGRSSAGTRPNGFLESRCRWLLRSDTRQCSAMPLTLATCVHQQHWSKTPPTQYMQLEQAPKAPIMIYAMTSHCRPAATAADGLPSITLSLASL